MYPSAESFRSFHSDGNLSFLRKRLLLCPEKNFHPCLMIRNIGVAAVPGSSFFKEEVNHLIRLHFAREEKTLDEALDRLAKMAQLLA